MKGIACFLFVNAALLGGLSLAFTWHDVVVLGMIRETTLPTFAITAVSALIAAYSLDLYRYRR